MFWLKNGQVQGSLGVKNLEHWPWSLWCGESPHGCGCCHWAHWEGLKLFTNCPPYAGWHTMIDRDIVVVARNEQGWWEAVTGLNLPV